MTDEIFYRYRDQLYASSVDECGDYHGESQLVVHCEMYKVIKKTEKSALVVRYWGEGSFLGSEQKWMRLNAKKRFAAPTKKEALHHFIKRKERQAYIYSERLKDANRAIEIAGELMRNKEAL